MTHSKQQLEEDETAKKKGRDGMEYRYNEPPPKPPSAITLPEPEMKRGISDGDSAVQAPARRQHYLETKKPTSNNSDDSLDKGAAGGDASTEPISDDRERNRQLKVQPQQERRKDYLKNKQERKAAGVSREDLKDGVGDDLETGKARNSINTKMNSGSELLDSTSNPATTSLNVEAGVAHTIMPGAFRYAANGQRQLEDGDDDDIITAVTSPFPSPSPRPPPPPTEEPFIVTNVQATLVNDHDANKPIVTAESVQREGFFHNRKNLVLLLVILLCLVLAVGIGLGVSLSSSSGGGGPSPPQENKTSFAMALDPIDGEKRSMFGSSVSMCKDGSRFAVASPGNGRVQVFELDGQGGHIQLGQNFTFDPSVIGSSRHVRTGIVVDLSADCEVLAVGLPYHENKETGEQTGRVELYQYDTELDSWEELGMPNSIPGDMLGDFAGACISLSHDAGLVAIGSPGHAQNGEFSGQVRVFQLAQRNDSWGPFGSTMYGKIPNESFGFSVSLASQDGSNVVAVGGTTPPGTSIAAATVFRFHTGEWIQRGSAILPDPRSLVGIETAWIVRLSIDGSMFVISNVYLGGGVVSNNTALYVAAYEFNTEQDDWSQLGRNLHTNLEGPKSGYTVALSEDGTRIAMGDPCSGDIDLAGGLSGHAHIYDYSEGQWCQLGENIEGYAAGDLAGFSVSLSGDGNRILVGSPLNRALGTERGRVWMKDIMEDAMTLCE